MDTPEVIVYLLVAVITGGIILAVFGHLHTGNITHAVTSLFQRSPTSPYASVDDQNLTPLLYHVWEDCNHGVSPKTVAFQYQGRPGSAATIALPLLAQHLCTSLSLRTCGCGNRDDITYSGTPITDCNRPAINPGTIYTATCNTTTHTLDLDITPQPCTDHRPDKQVCQDNNTTCGNTTDLCGTPRPCPPCTPPACTDSRDDNTVCNATNTTCGHTTDTCGVTRRCSSCPPPSPFLVIRSNTAPLDLTTGRQTYPGRLSGLFDALATIQNPDYLVTGQIIEQNFVGCQGIACFANLATAFTLNDPVRPQMEPRIDLHRISGDYLQHGNLDWLSYAATPDLAYQVLTVGNNENGILPIITPTGEFDGSVGSGGADTIVYGIATHGNDAYAALYGGVVYLTGIQPRPNMEFISGKKVVHCPDEVLQNGDWIPNPSYNRCIRGLYTIAPLPTAAPDLRNVMGPKAVFDDNIIILQGGAWDTSLAAYVPVNLTLYSLDTPTPLQVIPLRALQRLTLVSKTLPQGRFLLVTGQDVANSTTRQYAQVFTLTGTGRDATLKNATPLITLPGTTYATTIVSIAGEPLIIDVTMPPRAIHAYLMNELNAGTVRDAFYNPPTVPNAFLAANDRTIASYSKNGTAFLYFSLGTNGGASNATVWTITKKP